MLLTFLQTAGKISASGLAFVIAGYLTPYLTHITKNYLGVDSLWAYSVHMLFSVALAIGSLALTGEMTLNDVVNQTGVIHMLSQSLFQVWKHGSGLNIEPTPPPQPSELPIAQ